MLWEVDIYPAPGQPDLLGRPVATAAAELGLAADLRVLGARGYLIQADWERGQADRVVRELLTDCIVETAVVAEVGNEALTRIPQAADPKVGAEHLLIHVLPKPGVMDPVAQSVTSAIADLGLKAQRFAPEEILDCRPSARSIAALSAKVLANDAIEQVIVGPFEFPPVWNWGPPTISASTTVPLRAMDDEALRVLSRKGQLYLSLVEMQTIQAHFRKLDRDPTDAELETIAQTWSEHCSHKTLAGRIRYRDGSRRAGLPEHAQRNDLRRHGEDPPRTG